MTNETIILQDCISCGYEKETVQSFFQKFNFLPMNTFQTWKALGFIVRKGEKSKCTTYLWKPKGKKKKQEDEEAENGFVKVKSYLFDISQVEKLS